MTTIEQLNKEIRALQDKNVLWETQLTNLLNEGIGGMDKEQKLLMIKYYGDRISEINNQILEKDKLIAAKEIEKDKVIAAKEIEKDKVIAAKEIEKARQITLDKQYRLERGEITASPILYLFFIFYKIILRPLHPL